MALNLTLPGLSAPKAPPPPPAPVAPPPPPTQVDASRQVAQRGRAMGGMPANIRNEGGGRGLATSMVQRALKSLTGQ